MKANDTIAYYITRTSLVAAAFPRIKVVVGGASGRVVRLLSGVILGRIVHACTLTVHWHPYRVIQHEVLCYGDSSLCFVLEVVS